MQLGLEGAIGGQAGLALVWAGLKVSVILVCLYGGSTPMGFDAALLVTSAKDSPLPLPLAFPPLVQLVAMPVSPKALSAGPPLQGRGILGWP